MIDFDYEAPGIHLIFTVVNAQPVTAENVQEVSGTLVWDETEVQLCSIDIREGGDDWLHIGDIWSGCWVNGHLLKRSIELRVARRQSWVN